MRRAVLPPPRYSSALFAPPPANQSQRGTPLSEGGWASHKPIAKVRLLLPPHTFPPHPGGRRARRARSSIKGGKTNMGDNVVQILKKSNCFP